jgi:hypothetical protein
LDGDQAGSAGALVAGWVLAGGVCAVICSAIRPNPIATAKYFIVKSSCCYGT